jgi:hypothetical protein
MTIDYDFETLIEHVRDANYTMDPVEEYEIVSYRIYGGLMWPPGQIKLLWAWDKPMV